MKCWEVRGKGGPEVMYQVPRPMPEPGRGQVRLRVQRAGVAFGDVMRRQGLLAPWRPFVPGYDVVGVIDAVGDGVDPLPGGRFGVLMPSPGLGGYATHVVVPARLLVPIPDQVSADDAMALGLNYISAYQMLHRVLRLPQGASLLVHGAAGGVGTALLDLGRRAGLHLLGTASAPKHDVVASYGAVPIDYRSQDFVDAALERVPEGLDAITDPIGRQNLLRSRRALKKRGALVGFGFTGELSQGWWGLLASLGVWTRLCLDPGVRFRAYGVTVPPFSSKMACRDDWQTLVEQHAAEGLRPLVGATFPFEQAAEAMEAVAQSRVRGKVLLEVG